MIYFNDNIIFKLLFQEYSHDMYSYLGNSYANALTYVSYVLKIFASA